VQQVLLLAVAVAERLVADDDVAIAGEQGLSGADQAAIVADAAGFGP
jgi:hypothetical protein